MTGFWIHPDGQIIEFEYRRHIDLIIDNPEIYGENIDEIKRLYVQHNEPLRFEGHARQIIMQRIIKRAFIRIRQQKNQWMVQIWEITPANQDYLYKWSKLVDHHDKYADVIIDRMGAAGNKIIQTSLDRIAFQLINVD